MATAADVVTAVQSALDVAQQFAGMPTTSEQLAALQAQITQLTADKAALQAKIDAAKVAAQADKDADNARVAGQGVLDALA